jgi:hypothetical protein
MIHTLRLVASVSFIWIVGLFLLAAAGIVRDEPVSSWPW